MNYSEEIPKTVDKKNFTAVNSMTLHLRHNSFNFKVRYRQKKKKDKNTKRVSVFSLHSHFFQAQIEQPEGNKAICRNVS